MILETYRGFTITDEPNGFCPFSIFDEMNNRILDDDSETIEEVRRTIDIEADEREAEQVESDYEALPEWRKRITHEELWPRRQGH